MTTLSDLASWPTPAVIETLSFETIFSELQTEFQSRYPDYSALLASDPAVKSSSYETLTFEENPAEARFAGHRLVIAHDPERDSEQSQHRRARIWTSAYTLVGDRSKGGNLTVVSPDKKRKLFDSTHTIQSGIKES